MADLLYQRRMDAPVGIILFTSTIITIIIIISRNISFIALLIETPAEDREQRAKYTFTQWRTHTRAWCAKFAKKSPLRVIDLAVRFCGSSRIATKSADPKFLSWPVVVFRFPKLSKFAVRTYVAVLFGFVTWWYNFHNCLLIYYVRCTHTKTHTHTRIHKECTTISFQGRYCFWVLVDFSCQKALVGKLLEQTFLPFVSATLTFFSLTLLCLEP